MRESEKARKEITDVLQVSCDRDIIRFHCVPSSIGSRVLGEIDNLVNDES